jgi:hypothetical protein
LFSGVKTAYSFPAHKYELVINLSMPKALGLRRHCGRQMAGGYGPKMGADAASGATLTMDA